MCGRYLIKHNAQQMALMFHVEQIVADTAENYNTAPTQTVPAVLLNEGQLTLAGLRWGLIPSWASSMNVGARMINARSETIMEKPSFRGLLRRRRCLLPADGFYEWKRTGSKKQPYLIHRRDNETFAFAGLWDEWKDPDGALIRSCTIITTAANEMMQAVHDRMPVILPEQAQREWLDPGYDSPVNLLLPCPSDDLEMYPVDPRVNSPVINDAGLILPAMNSA